MSTLEWFFGRGLSIGCGLTWVVPSDWGSLRREQQIVKIIDAIRQEMVAAYVDTQDIQVFLEFLAGRTLDSWQHRFYTTNWDYLLQREISALGHTVLPSWCANSHVFHLNGTAENLRDNSQRSGFVLETDGIATRLATTEGNIAFNSFIWSKMFVVVGMSFECEVDKYLLSKLNTIEDDLPVGESCWFVLNPNQEALSAVCARIQESLPRACVVGINASFRAWIDGGASELQSVGIIAPK